MNKLIFAEPIGENFSPIGSAASQSNSAFSPTGSAEKFVVFFLSGRLYGVATEKIAEVSPPLPVAVVPHAPEWLLGIANLRGEMMTVINAAKILGGKTETSRDKMKFVVLQTKKYDTIIAFPIDRLSEITTLSGKPAAASADLPFVFGKLEYQSNEIRLIDVERMLSSIAPE